jgi:hypothetical protein
MNKKVKLDLDRLEVESFSTDGDGAGRRGTVRGNSGTTAASDGSNCMDITCFYGCWNDPTADASCTCGGTATAYPCCPQME